MSTSVASLPQLFTAEAQVVGRTDVDQAIERAITTLAALSAKYPHGVAPRIEPPASSTEIADLQAASGGSLPAAVRSFFRRSRAIVAMDIRNGYWIGGPAELSRSIRRHDYPTEFDANGRFVHAFPIATDGGGNAFMFAVGVGSVWRWDHETGAVACVSGDLPEFLCRVAEDWEHDLDGDSAWSYLV
jgi:hypothetical protein